MLPQQGVVKAVPLVVTNLYISRNDEQNALELVTSLLVIFLIVVGNPPLIDCDSSRRISSEESVGGMKRWWEVDIR